MLELNIQSAAVYRQAQRGHWTSPMPSLSLYVRGLRWRRRGSVTATPAGPAVSLRPAGDSSEFEYGPERENWVVLMDTPDVQPSSSPDTVRLKRGKEWILLPQSIPVPALELPILQARFGSIVDASHDPSRTGRARASAKVFEVIGWMLDRHVGAQALSPAGTLKRLIDEDTAWNRNMESLSRLCGFSADHLRRAFVREFGMKPHDYRHRRRMAQVTRLLAQTQCSIKEIAARLGFRHNTHLFQAYKKATGRTPVQARQELQGPPHTVERTPRTRAKAEPDAAMATAKRRRRSR